MNDSNNSKTVQVLREEYYFLDVYISKLERENQDLVKRHIELENSLAELRKYYKDFEQFAATVYDPNKPTYKELENKLGLAENSKQTEIEKLYETEIRPMRKRIAEYEKELQLLQSMRSNDTIEIKDLKKIIKDRETIIQYAAGYISSCEQFRDKHPTDVVKWLFKGINEYNNL